MPDYQVNPYRNPADKDKQKMRYLVEETITYYIEAASEDDARAIWENLPTPQVEGLDGPIYTETLGLSALTLDVAPL